MYTLFAVLSLILATSVLAIELPSYEDNQVEGYVPFAIDMGFIKDMLLEKLTELETFPIIGGLVSRIRPIILPFLAQALPIVNGMIGQVAPIIIRFLMQFGPLLASVMAQLMPIYNELLERFREMIKPFFLLVQSIVMPIFQTIFPFAMPFVMPVFYMISSFLGIY